ncbi:MAG: thiamine pyrophosphate-binding protein [bacterium]
MVVKLAEYVAEWLKKAEVGHVFAITGGASLHLIDGIAKTKGIEYVCPAHEQAGAFAADAYARASGGLGVSIGTSGPGSTNMLTGAAGAYYDSVPVMFLTGQVATFRFREHTGVRQMGFQETDTVDIFRPVTKYAVKITDPYMIGYELDKAAYIAKQDRPGPVLIDIPDDLQRKMIDPKKLKLYKPKAEVPAVVDVQDLRKSVLLIEKAERPVMILGWGVRLAQAEDQAAQLIEKIKIPVALTWAVADLLPASNPNLIGTFGTHGTRYGNFAVQNADLVLSIGCRLDTRATGGMDTFARGAKKIVVDVDNNELGKYDYYGMKADLLIKAEAKKFLMSLNEMLPKPAGINYAAWRNRISNWKERYPVCAPEYYDEKKVNPYVFVKELSKRCREGEKLVVDTGCTVAWMMQGFEFKKNQRLWHDFNYTAMGWALPAAMGVSLAGSKSPVICVTGDGSLMMNMQELATVIRHKAPIKIFVLDNQGYGMIQQTQDQWLNSKYEASSVASGLSFPDWGKIARAFGFKTVVVEKNDMLQKAIGACLENPGPTFCVVKVDISHRVLPQVKFGRPLEDSEPLLPRRELIENMIVEPLDVSLDVSAEKVQH